MIAARFQQDLMGLGLKKGDTVLIHCSYKALGGGLSPEDFFAGLQSVLGEEGTLVMPALSYETVDENQPVFDREKTPSCVGFLPEYFRTKVPGVVRSIHATHSCCAWGKNADFLTADHERDETPVGENSPFTKLPKLDGKILILGSHPDHNTTLHGVEEKGNAPYIFEPDQRTAYVLKADGREIRQSALRHMFVKEDHFYGQKYDRILNLLTEGECTRGKVLQADCYLMDAKAVWKKGVAKLQQDPYYFVDRMDISLLETWENQ